MARRRSHGEGAIYRRASDKRWVGALDLGYGGGKRRRKTVYGNTEREVVAALRDLRRSADAGRDHTLATPTMTEWFDQWQRMKKADGLRASTLRFYAQLIDAHIKPDLGRKRLDKLTASDIRNLISAKTDSHLSPATVGHILRLLRNTLGEAERLDMVARNVAKSVRMPRIPEHQVEALDVQQARRLLAVIEGHRLSALFSTALVLGLRRGEVLGLSWTDLDFEAGTVRVRHSLQRLDGSLKLVPPKTRASVGRLAAPPGLMKMLAKHRVQQRAERLALGSDWPGLDLVFTSTVGTPLEPRNVSREWDAVRREADLPNLRFHDLRHSCATILTALGVHPRVADALETAPFR